MQSPSNVKFNEITVWARCHKIPLTCMDPDIIARIGSKVGKVKEVDVGESGLCVGKFAKVRITRDIDTPLVRCVPLAHDGTGKEALILLQYERLPEFCFACGRIGHISQDCWDEEADKSKTSFESWLRAGRTNNGVITKEHTPQVMKLIQVEEQEGDPKVKETAEKMMRGLLKLREGWSGERNWRKKIARRIYGYTEVDPYRID